MLRLNKILFIEAEVFLNQLPYQQLGYQYKEWLKQPKLEEITL